jgi:hypothetical protein
MKGLAEVLLPTLKVYRITAEFPKEERLGLISQNYHGWNYELETQILASADSGCIEKSRPEKLRE